MRAIFLLRLRSGAMQDDQGDAQRTDGHHHEHEDILTHDHPSDHDHEHSEHSHDHDHDDHEHEHGHGHGHGHEHGSVNAELYGNEMGLRAVQISTAGDRKSTRLNSSHVAISY